MMVMMRIGIVMGPLVFSACAAPAPETILFNGKIFTANAARPWAEALAIRGERIIAVGDNTTITGQAGPSTRRLDLGGRTVVPGFNDAHVHVAPRPPGFQVSVPDEPSTAQVEQALASADKAAPPGQRLQVQIGAQVLDDPAVTRASRNGPFCSTRTPGMG
jgi:predicted amidohydrolase YtcJ